MRFKCTKALYVRYLDTPGDTLAIAFVPKKLKIDATNVLLYK